MDKENIYCKYICDDVIENIFSFIQDSSTIVTILSDELLAEYLFNSATRLPIRISSEVLLSFKYLTYAEIDLISIDHIEKILELRTLEKVEFNYDLYDMNIVTTILYKIFDSSRKKIIVLKDDKNQLKFLIDDYGLGIFDRLHQYTYFNPILLYIPSYIERFKKNRTLRWFTPDYYSNYYTDNYLCFISSTINSLDMLILSPEIIGMGKISILGLLREKIYGIRTTYPYIRQEELDALPDSIDPIEFDLPIAYNLIDIVCERYKNIRMLQIIVTDKIQIDRLLELLNSKRLDRIHILTNSNIVIPSIFTKVTKEIQEYRLPWLKR